MTFPAGAALLGGLSLAACASAPGGDGPVPLEPGYAAREAAAGKPADRCGPEFISDHLPAPLMGIIGPMLDGPFRPACARHDACYELREASQVWCDERMLTEMNTICRLGRSPGSLSGALCRVRAGLYFALVDNAFGAYSYHGAPGGTIAGVDTTAGICVTVKNTSPLFQKYAIELRSDGGERIMRRPRVGDHGLRGGESAPICLRPPARAGREAVEIVLLADDPDRLTLANDLRIVDRQRLRPAGH